MQQIHCHFDVWLSTNSKTMLYRFPQNRLSNLVCLDYDHSGGPPNDIADAIMTAKNLKVLRLANINPWSFGHNQQIVGLSLIKKFILPNLRELYLLDCKPDIDQLPGSLQILSISFLENAYSSDSWTDGTYESYWSAIFKLEHLRSLSVKVNYHSPIPTESPDHEVEFQGLESFYLQLPSNQPKVAYEVSTSILRKILEHNPKLKHVHYPHIPSNDLSSLVR